MVTTDVRFEFLPRLRSSKKLFGALVDVRVIVIAGLIGEIFADENFGFFDVEFGVVGVFGFG